MKLTVVCIVLICAVVYAKRIQRQFNENPSWMLISTETGELHLATFEQQEKYVKAEWDPFVEITFHLFTRSNPTEAVQIYVGNLNNSAYDPLKPTRFIVHGYNSNFFSGSNLAMKDAFLRAEDSNVIGVDWSGPGGGPLYNVCRNNSRPTGDYLGVFYDYLISVGSAYNLLHCVGHSLGSHVCGYSGKTVNGSLGRISGLDPALPLFDYDTPDDRLADTDALYVDIIHTCGGYLGFERPIGHSDYFPNGGTRIQPGCGLDVSGGCSHGRSHEFFVESIESSNFVSLFCSSYIEYNNGTCFMNEESLMGFPSDPSSRGSYYLSTAAEPPYALG